MFFPEEVAVADALLDPVMAQRAWADSGVSVGGRCLPMGRSAVGSGTTWRSVVPAEQRALITALVDKAGEQLAQLHGTQHATIKRAVLNKVGTAMGYH
ncbi:hypothetical protein ACH4CE_17370 [Streptomyces gelaticus]|uniref:hypothetical protein n=1 Tax=Streptomyces gelaticus TaxID=285446 RepID=UPI0037B36762